MILRGLSYLSREISAAISDAAALGIVALEDIARFTEILRGEMSETESEESR